MINPGFSAHVFRVNVIYIYEREDIHSRNTELIDQHNIVRKADKQIGTRNKDIQRGIENPIDNTASGISTAPVTVQ